MGGSSCPDMFSKIISTLFWSALFVSQFEDAVGSPVHRWRRNIDGDSNGPKVFLTVSSLASKRRGVVTERLLELNWYNAPPGLNENNLSWVGLFTHDPTEGIHDPIEQAQTKDHPTGNFRTTTTFHRPTFLASNLTESCLGYWVAYVSAGEVLDTNCIKSRPNWMYENRHIIGDHSLTEVMIPGTHNTGSYEHYNPQRDTVFTRYQKTQDEDVWNQLVYGIRYLDIRVAYQSISGSTNKLWITHSVFRSDIPVSDILVHVKEFLNATNEIVILDFHRFETGFGGVSDKKRHGELIEMLHNELGEYMVPTDMGYYVTPNQLWDSGKRLFVGYDNKERRQSDRLFRGVRHLWANVDKVSELEEYLTDTVCRPRSLPRSAMAQLTPKAAGLIFDTYGGLRKMAQDVNLRITEWFRNRWWHCSNIVATDYFLGNNLIEVSINANSRRWGS